MIAATHLQDDLPRPGSAMEQPCPNCTWPGAGYGNPLPLLLLLDQLCTSGTSGTSGTSQAR